ncbi:MAG: helix-turn-helix domain-containing protein [Janthinobacterium lividum]
MDSISMRLVEAAWFDGSQASDFKISGKRANERMRFGEGLKVHRERRGISLDDVAISTRVSLRHLSALEEERFTELPGGVFSRGIVRSYAQCCGLDMDDTVRGFLDAVRASGLNTEQRDDDWVEFAEAVKRNRKVASPRRRLRWLGVVLMILAVLTLATGVFWLLISRHAVTLPPKLTERLQHLHLP